MKIKTQTNGYSLVEVLVAVAILMFSIVGPITIAAKSLQSAQYARQQNTAFFLAQEGISAINTIRNDAAVAVLTSGSGNLWAWSTSPAYASCFLATGCNIDFRDATLNNNIVNCATAPTSCTLRFNEAAGRSVYRLNSGVITPYKRVITLRRIGADEVAVTSRVEWSSAILGGIQEVSLSTSLFNTFK